MMRRILSTVVATGAVFGAGAVSAAVQSHPSGPVEVPLSIHGGRLVVPVMTADGGALQFVLSTGAGQTVFSESLAARLGDAPHLSMGGLEVPTDDFQAIPDERLGADGVQLDGMIGANMLNQFDVLIDVPGNRLVLKPAGGAVAWEGMKMSDPVGVRLFHGTVLYFEVEVEGKPYPATLDLGTPMLVVNEGVKKDTQIDDLDEVTLAIGGARLAGLPVSVLDLEVLRRFSPDGAGFVMVGAPVAYDCAMSISWVHREIRTCVR